MDVGLLHQGGRGPGAYGCCLLTQGKDMPIRSITWSAETGKVAGPLKRGALAVARFDSLQGQARA